MVTPTATYYPSHDGLGSTVALTDGRGAVVERYRYDAFGLPAIISGDYKARAESVAGFRFLFTGREWLNVFELNDHRNRYYNPNLGGWLSTDPIGFKGGHILYGYVANSPITVTDPFGLDIWIEGPSGGEPNGHQSINVGNPNGSYKSYSFGITSLSVFGTPYTDVDRGGAIEAYKATTPGQDAAFERFLNSQAGDSALYGPNTCRTWSQGNFALAPGSSTAPPTTTTAPRSTGRQCLSSSAPTTESPSLSGTSSCQ